MLQDSFEAIKQFGNTSTTIPIEESSIICQICFNYQPLSNFFSVGCQHFFCKFYLQSHIKQLIDNYQIIKCAQTDCSHIIDYTDKSIYHLLDYKTKKIVDSILSNYKRMNTIKTCKGCNQGSLFETIQDQKVILLCDQCSSKHCYNCFKPLHPQQSFCTSEEQTELPADCQQCRKCSTIIHKQIGCKHMKCLCGYEFCFECGFHWDPSHICEHKIPRRQGMSKFCCCALKVILAPPMFVGMLLFLIVVVLSICMVSATIGGVIVWGQFMTAYLSKKKDNKIHLQQMKGKEDSPSSLFQCLLLVLSIILLPLFLIIFGIIGFFVPLVNICYKKKIFFEPSLLSDLCGEIQRWIQVFMMV